MNLCFNRVAEDEVDFIELTHIHHYHIQSSFQGFPLPSINPIVSEFHSIIPQSSHHHYSLYLIISPSNVNVLTPHVNPAAVNGTNTNVTKTEAYPSPPPALYPNAPNGRSNAL